MLKADFKWDKTSIVTNCLNLFNFQSSSATLMESIEHEMKYEGQQIFCQYAIILMIIFACSENVA